MTQTLKTLRKELMQQGMHGFLLPKMDAHRCEITLDHDNYLQFLTGFTGSAGFAIILQDAAAIFVDGRYTLQAQYEVKSADFSHVDYTMANIQHWIIKYMQEGQTLAYDRLMFSEEELKKIKACCKEKQIILKGVDQNPLDKIWQDRPAQIKPLLEAHPLEFTGEEHKDKLKKLTSILQENSAQGIFLNTPEAIAWLLNIRSSQRPYTPAASCYFYLNRDNQGVLFIDQDQAPVSVQAHLNGSIKILPYENAFSYLQSVAHNQVIMMDPSEVPIKAIELIEQHGGTVLRKSNPCNLAKACKNAVELQGARDAHILDGAAVVNFLAWLYQHDKKQDLTEIEISDKLLEFRQQQPLFQAYSFETIAGSGPHGAIIHYRASESTNRHLQENELLLLDSGGHYLNGTTDITRTLSLNGQPTSEEKDRFTRVLKGHISLASLIFPVGTTGTHIDAFARQFLWQIGCDYAHGTGHGVGSYLGVHEGPQRISIHPNSIPLMPGMILSNEPGYYKQDAYGIRIESLIIVQKLTDPRYEREMLGFETITMAPIDLSLIEKGLLTPSEIKWLNQYHTQVRSQLIPVILPESQAWLKESTREL